MGSPLPSSVLQLTPIPFGDQAVVGGGERYPTELSRAMARYVPTTLVSFGGRLTAWREGNLTLKTYPVLRYVDHKRVNPLSPWFLFELLGPDTIHCHQYQTLVTNMAVLFGSLLKKRTFATDHGGGGRNYSRRLRIGERLTGFLPVSRFSASFYPELAHKTVPIDSGVNPDLFRPQPVERERSALYVGRILPHKGIDYLIRAVGSDVQLRVVGRLYDQSYYRYLRELAEGKQVVFVTDASDQDILREYSRAAVAVLPSVYVTFDGARHRMPELLGITLLEAMACETPVICTNVGGMPEAVMEGITGYVVPPNDPETLRDRLYRLLDDPTLARSMGKDARQMILEHWTWDHVARRCLEAYATLGSGGGGRGTVGV
ncbi:MAG: glycosyltransferase family 4 protein [Sphingomonadaceae bacterium]